MCLPATSFLRSKISEIEELHRSKAAHFKPSAGLSRSTSCSHASKLVVGALCTVFLTVPALAAELAPKGNYVSTDITCAQFNAGEGNSMSLIAVDGLRFSSGKAYCDMQPTTKPNVYRAVCRAFPLPGASAPSADVIEFEGEKTFKWVPPDTVEIDDGRQFKLCEVTP